MFNDKYGLTAAVLAGTKTQTRRIINAMPKDPKIAYGLEDEAGYVHLLDGYTVVAKSRFKFGEVVAVAQPYKDIREKSDKYLNEWCGIVACNGMDTVGYDNKMFVRADLMPHRIRIEKVRVERLQDISDEDCLEEGIDIGIDDDGRTIWKYYDSYYFDSPKDAYASIIDKISGKGTWESNPYVFVYEFKLVKQ
jgi:hypothetical protein